eukprot:CAMPEP_0197182618 /NCGR_PEP_ID=MMETSP1423-20130617/6516_1 /TAXON_ID=476441 /ORGANISM="Pseudo-nitzschia heimii, Strain UNC1101" /LENGTH=494 /DNA_ID=CAMNT_0042633065 /DNA_START=141 /DNA_END=1625 /DNA_ORIENTATION=+
MTSPSASPSQKMDQSYQNDEAFEMILPHTNTSRNPKKSEGRTPVLSLRETICIDKRSSVPSNFRAAMRIAMAVAVGAASGLFVGVVASRDTIRELRSEFKRDIDSLRNDVERELGVQFIATAAVVQLTANEIVTEAQHQHAESVANFKIRQADAEAYSTTEASGSPPIDSKSSEHLLGDGSHLREGGAFPSFEWTDTILGWLQAVKIFASAVFDWIQETIVCVRNLWSDGSATVAINWIQNMTLLPAIYLESLALRGPFADGVFFSAFLRLVLLLLVTYCVAYDWVWDCIVDRYRSTGVPDSSARARDKEISNVRRADGPEESIPDLVETKEDAIMEQVFYESVASAMMVPGVPGSDASSKKHDNSHRRVFATRTQGSAIAIDPSPTKPPLTSRTKISKKERIHGARINGQAFGARDASKLSNAAAGMAAAAKRSTVRNPLRTPPSPWHEKQERLQRARASAKVFGEQDKERLRQARINSPWRKKTTAGSDGLG